MAKKHRPNPRIHRTAPQPSGNAPLVKRWYGVCYRWSGLPYGLTEPTKHWLLGLGVVVVGVCYLQQITWQAKIMYRLNDLQTQAAQAQSDYQQAVTEAADAASLKTVQTVVMGFVPVTDVVFAEH